MGILLRYQIDVLVDVRHIAGSRKPGFNRSQLLKTAIENQVSYVHFPGFGARPEFRKRLRETRDWQNFASEYLAYIAGLNGTLETSFSEFEGKRICLLCLEADPERCHRSLLANVLTDAGITRPPIHLR